MIYTKVFLPLSDGTIHSWQLNIFEIIRMLKR